MITSFPIWMSSFQLRPQWNESPSSLLPYMSAVSDAIDSCLVYSIKYLLKKKCQPFYQNTVTLIDLNDIVILLSSTFWKENRFHCPPIRLNIAQWMNETLSLIILAWTVCDIALYTRSSSEFPFIFSIIHKYLFLSGLVKLSLWL